jgi:hypothetical protein
VPILLNRLRYRYKCDRDTLIEFWTRYCLGLEGVGNYLHSMLQPYGTATASTCTGKQRPRAEDPWLLLSLLRPGDFTKRIAQQPNESDVVKLFPLGPVFDCHVIYIYSFLFGGILPLFLLFNLSMYILENINDTRRMRRSE